MKMNTQSFPYPVLANIQGSGADYKDSAFQCTLSFSSSVSDDCTVDVEYNFMLSNDELQSLISSGHASYAIEICCTDTLTREVRFVDKSGEIKIDASDLYGKVDFTPMIVVRKRCKDFTSADLNVEYDNALFDLKSGDIVAVDETWTKYLEFNDLSFDSLIKVTTDSTLGEFEYKIETSPSLIYIRMGEKMRDIWNHMNQDKLMKPTLAVSVYKDVICFAIEDMIMNEDSESNRWCRALSTTIGKAGLTMPEEKDFNSINLLAQSLIKHIGVQKIYSRMG